MALTPRLTRVDRQGALMSNETHGRWLEAASQGSVYWADTGSAVTIPIFSSTAPVATLYNPANSNVNVEVIAIALTWASTTATTVIGGFCLGYSLNPSAPTGTTLGTINSMPLNGGISPGNKASFYSAATLGAAPGLLAGLGLQVQNTSGANNFGGISEIDLDGTLVLAPGSLIVIGASVAVSEANYIVDMQWAEWTV